MYNIAVTEEHPALTEAVAFTFKGEGSETIHAMKWIPPKKNIKALIIINHGMAEHIERYSHFATFMASRGFAVYGEDHRGHGKTAGSEEHFGYFADKQGWMKVVGDIRSLYLLATEEQKGVPVFFFGHSMGSFLTRHYLSLYGSELAGAVISGTGSHRSALLTVASVLAKIESSVKGRRHRSKLLDTMSFGAYNKPFAKEDQTGFEWLTRDTEQVRKYVEDSYCGFISTSGMYADLFNGLQIINHPDCFKATHSKLPLLLYSGKSDPVGGENGKGVISVAESYRKAGIEDLTLIIKEDHRHECLNELERESVYEEIHDWLAARITG